MGFGAAVKRLLRTVLLVLLAVAASLVGAFAVGPAATAVARTQSTIHAYSYDGHHNAALSTETTTERGPPAVVYAYTPLASADDRGSRGLSARPQQSSAWIYTTYDHLVRSVQTRTGGGRTRTASDGGAAQVRAVLGSRRAAKGAIDIRPPLSMGSKQFGTKWGKHAADYGLDPASSSSRTWFMNRARDVHLNPTEVRRGAWNPSGGGGENYFFFRQGDDLLITRPGGEFVTMFPGGSTNAWFKNAEVFPH